MWVALAALPVILYWGLLRGNSGRHNLLPVIFLYFLLALPLMGRVRWAWGALLAVMVLVNYVTFPPSANTVLPSGRLLESARLIQERTAALHALGREVADLPHTKVAVMGEGWMHPYITYEILQAEQYVRHSGSDSPSSPQQLTTLDHGMENDYLLVYDAVDMPRMVSLADQGYYLVVGTGSMSGDMADHPSLAGKYVALDSLDATDGPR
jgi:hypothetical protein